MKLKLKLGNCLDVLKTMPDNYVDSIVTDPPYGLSFMGKQWDYDVPTVEMWQECLRVLKPGGHLLAFGGTRTYHRLVVAIEDAGFEIRDQIQWLTGQGFPKNLNIKKAAIKEGIACECEESTEHGVRPVSDADISTTINTEDKPGEVLQSGLSKQGTPSHRDTDSTRINEGREQPGLEGRELSRAGQRLSHDSTTSAPKGEGERLRAGTYPSSGTDVRSTTNGDGGSTSYQPRPTGQPTGELKGVRQSHGALDGTSLPRCPNCQKAIFSEGLGSALKPANEPICLARKPLSEKTVAKNVLKHGTGGLNIDASRIETADNLNGGAYTNQGDRNPSSFLLGSTGKEYTQPTGRFPSNVILDETAAEILDGQSGILKSGTLAMHHKVKGSGGNSGFLGSSMKRDSFYKDYGGDSGGASRFFYVAKASKSDRGVGNSHPTVKPVKLMEYLVKLVTPTGGIVLDPFMGSGTTGVAAKRLGFGFVGIEMSEEYFNIAKSRIEGVKGDDDGQT
jgi:hypothetical protein